MRILFFPSDLGSGFGHISRCLSLAHAAQRAGHACAVVLNDAKYAAQVHTQCELSVVSVEHPLKKLDGLLKKVKIRSAPSRPLFTELSGLDYQVLRDGLISRRVVRRRLDRYASVVRRFRPDVLVGDTNLLVWMLSQRVGLPAVQIVRYGSHPLTAGLLWWKAPCAGTVLPAAVAFMNGLLREMGIETIGKTEDLFRGHRYIVPSIPDIEPVPADSTTQFVGALCLPDSDPEPGWMRDLPRNRPVVYVTIGGGAGPVGNRVFFETVAEALHDRDVSVVVSTTQAFAGHAPRRVSGNISCFSWVPGRRMIARADLVIFHGGYGTMMETVACGKPSIVIPFHSEQESNGRRLEHLGCGRVLMLSREGYQCVTRQWNGSDYTYFVQNRYDLTSGALRRDVEQMLADSVCAASARTVMRTAQAYGGADQALHIIEQML